MATVRNTLLTGTARENFCAQVSRMAASESMVLLKNEGGLLPLKAEEGKYPVAVFGIGQIYTIKGGSGSGEVNNVRNVNILEGLTACESLEVDRLVASKYEAWAANHPKKVVGFLTPDVFSEDQMPMSVVNVELAAERNKAAIIVISRIAGEGADMPGKKGDYFLQDDEVEMIDEVCRYFENVVLLLNTSGVIDSSFIDDRFKAVLFTSLPGQEAGHAVADVLCGAVTPSGKLTDSWARHIEDYPAYRNFGTHKKNGLEFAAMGPGPGGGGLEKQCYINYEEGVFVGYRYFDTFGVDVTFPFGYGLSYAEFETTDCAMEVESGKITVKATVCNVSEKYSGKDVLEVYFSAPDGKLEKPYQELAGFAKTGLLAPGESQQLRVTFDVADMASYSEQDFAYILESGHYFIRAGRSSRDTYVVGAVYIDREVRTLTLSNRMHRTDSPDFKPLTKQGANPFTYEGEKEQLEAAAKMAVRLSSKTFKGKTVHYSSQFKGCVPAGDELLTLDDVFEGKCTVYNVVAQMSIEEMATLCCGTGMDMTAMPADIFENMPKPQDDGEASHMGVGGMDLGEPNSVPGAAGQTADMSEKYGIRRIILADGPAGVRITREIKDDEGEVVKRQNCTAFPVGTLLASSWDKDLIRSVGAAVGLEMLEYKVDLWLAPGMNIHRHPFCGRNFEYYSEDPRLTGLVAAAITEGVQSRGVGVTLKHFACNSQENQRTNSNSVVEQRALREIYLKGFELAVRIAEPLAIMTSYNDINGVPAADNYDLCTAIARDEWGFKGLIMTDWGGGQSSPAMSMYAGNDMIQPGGKSSIQAIIGGIESGEPVVSKGEAKKQIKVTRAMLEKSVCHILNVILKLPRK